MTERVFQRCADIDDNDVAYLHPSAIIRNLLLHDQFVIDSGRLREIPALARAFGVEGLRTLLDSGVLRFKCTAMTMAQIAQTRIGDRANKPPLPLGTYCPVAIWEHDRADYISRSLGSIGDIPNLSSSGRQKLRRSISHALVDLGPNPVERRVKPWVRLLADSHPILGVALADEYAKFRGVRLQVSDFRYRLHEVEPGALRLESSLTTDFGLSDHVAHRIGEAALLDVGHLVGQLDWMASFDAVSAMGPKEARLAAELMPFLAGARTTGVSIEHQFSRLVAVSGLPAPPRDLTFRIDVERLMRYRASDDFSLVRETVKSLDQLTDKELKERLADWRRRVGTWLSTPWGTIARLLVTTGAGVLVADAPGALVGLAADAADAFGLSRLFPRSPLVAFVQRHYRSVVPGRDDPRPTKA